MINKILPARITMTLLLLVSWPQLREGYAQQRVQYTQYMFSGLLINPAYAGAEGPLNIALIQRSQWTGVDGAPSTQTLLAHSLFKEKQMGIGLSVVNDRIGIHRNVNALANYAYHINVGHDTYLSFGLQAGVQNRKSDYLSLIGDANNDPHLHNPQFSHTAFDVGAGVYLRSGDFDMGLSVPEIIPQRLRLNDSLTIELGNRSYFLFSKYRISLNEIIDLEPSTLLKYLPGLPFSADFNLNVIFYDALTTGIAYRRDESIDFLLKARINAQLQIGYAYDHPVGEIAGISNGSHEMMISYLFRFVRSGIHSPR